MARVLSLVLVTLLVCQHIASAVTDEECQVDSVSQSCTVDEHSLLQKIMRDGTGRVGLHDATKPLLLRNAKFLMSHDSATGYIGQYDVNPEHVLAKTQRTGLVGQLKCGVRAFDLRLTIDYIEGEQYPPVSYIHINAFDTNHWHGWQSDQNVLNTLPSVVQWAEQHPNELVLLHLSHCAMRHKKRFNRYIRIKYTSLPCSDPSIISPFEDLGIPVWITVTNQQNMTLETAKQEARLQKSPQGMVLGFVGDNVNENWKEYVQWEEEKCDGKDWLTLYNYMNKVMNTTSDRMSQVQGLWQFSTVWRSPLRETEESNINLNILTHILKYGSRGIGILEVNDVCAHGVAIARALGTTVDEHDEEACLDECAAGGYPGWDPVCEWTKGDRSK